MHEEAYAVHGERISVNSSKWVKKEIKKKQTHVVITKHYIKIATRGLTNATCRFDWLCVISATGRLKLKPLVFCGNYESM